MKHLNLFFLFLFAISAIAITRVCAESNEKPADPETAVQLESLVRQWVELRLQIAEENRAWEEDKTALIHEISLIKKENEYLDTIIEENTRTEATLLENRAQLKERETDMRTTIAETSVFIEAAENRLNAWRKKIPAPFLKNMEPLFQQVSLPLEQRESHPASERLRNILALYEQIEKLQGNAHLVVEMIDTPSGRRETRVLYIGLAKAFAISADNQKAYSGVPSETGWQWTSAPELADTVSKTIAVYERKRVPELVKLPLGPAIE